MRARTLLTSLSATALVGAGVLVGLSLDTGPGGLSGPAGGRAVTSAGEERASGPQPVAWQGDALTPAASCEQLLDWYVDGAEELVTPWGWSGGWSGGWLDTGGAWRTFARDGVVELQGFAAKQAPAPGNARGMTNATQSETGTNVQEAGVDEPDVAKSDGRLLARVERTGRTADLVLADVTGESIEETARLDLPDVVDPELLLVGDTVVVVRFQGPRANGMPELHSLTPTLAVLQDRGLKVALVTDGRMSGASGKVPACIHVSPEAACGGPIAKLRDGDLVRVDATHGVLEVLEEGFDARELVTADLSANTVGMGRELFETFRQNAGPATEGACSLF